MPARIPKAVVIRSTGSVSESEPGSVWDGVHHVGFDGTRSGAVTKIKHD